MTRNRRFTVTAVLFAGAFATAAPALAQDRPFVLSLTTAQPTTKAQVRVDYDIGLGEQAFRASTDSGPEHRVGIQSTVGRWTLLGRFGVSSTGEAYAASQQAEVLFAVRPARAGRVSLAIGGGVLHEAGGTNVLLGRAAGGLEMSSWRLHSNALFQKPLAEGRDAMDVIVSAGWAWKAGSAVAFGLEGLGEDLEGFWEREETEGGARLLIGPSLHIAPPARRWQLSLVGGPSFHPTTSGLSSDAVRDLPARGWAMKASFSAAF